MRATVMYGAGDVRIENVPDPIIKESTDAIVRVTSACICGSDLWPYKSRKPEDAPVRMGHEFMGVVEAVGSDVRNVKKGDLVVAPFAWSDGTCIFCEADCRRRVFTADGGEVRSSTAAREKRCAFLRRMELSSHFQVEPTASSCHRC